MFELNNITFIIASVIIIILSTLSNFIILKIIEKICYKINPIFANEIIKNW